MPGVGGGFKGEGVAEVGIIGAGRCGGCGGRDKGMDARTEEEVLYGRGRMD